jgi:hypothetical protein
MGDPVTALNKQIARLRKFGVSGAELAPAAAEELKNQLLGNVAAQRGPDGTAWPATKDGSAALRNVAPHLDVTAVGSRIVARLSGHYVNQSIGWTRGHVARPIMPTRKLSQPMTKAIQIALGKRFRKLMSEGA